MVKSMAHLRVKKRGERLKEGIMKWLPQRMRKKGVEDNLIKTCLVMCPLFVDSLFGKFRIRLIDRDLMVMVE